MRSDSETTSPMRFTYSPSSFLSQGSRICASPAQRLLASSEMVLLRKATSQSPSGSMFSSTQVFATEATYMPIMYSSSADTAS